VGLPASPGDGTRDARSDARRSDVRQRVLTGESQSLEAHGFSDVLHRVEGDLAHDAEGDGGTGGGDPRSHARGDHRPEQGGQRRRIEEVDQIVEPGFVVDAMGVAGGIDEQRHRDGQIGHHRVALPPVTSPPGGGDQGKSADVSHGPDAHRLALVLGLMGIDHRLRDIAQRSELGRAQYDA